MTERLIFGVHTKEDAERCVSVNPCVDVFGKDPNGKMCKGCRHLVNTGIRRNYFLCRLKTWTSGFKKKHSEWWPACSKFEPEEK